MILEHSFEPPSNKHVVTQQPRSPPCDSPATRHAVPPASETPSRSDPWRLPTGTRDETKKSPNVPNNSWVWWCLWCYDWWALWRMMRWWWWWWWWWGWWGWRRWRQQQRNKFFLTLLQRLKLPSHWGPHLWVVWRRRRVVLWRGDAAVLPLFSPKWPRKAI